ncbi:hypothetical protein OUZ56_031118 [Daphnia magna]|uniref:Uncharacterized protein n=1 Tax=Daphnia magna TaxID=35525 RepID=A0ABQ9ZTB1_9CRUS|nr:hypothetical protein OUZ56_031118 [Daphnia magna]
MLIPACLPESQQAVLYIDWSMFEDSEADKESKPPAAKEKENEQTKTGNINTHNNNNPSVDLRNF